jgi:hypothetical protein
MNAAIELKIYGGSRHLATLKKDVEVPVGLYSENPISSAIGLTSSITANVNLQISNIAVDDNYNYLLVSSKHLQISELIPTLGIENFTAFINDSKSHGWTIEKYIDGINNLFLPNDSSDKQLINSIYTETALHLMLFLVLAATPVIMLVFSVRENLQTPFTVFVLFLCFAILIFYSVFAVLRRMNKRPVKL